MYTAPSNANRKGRPAFAPMRAEQIGGLNVRSILGSAPGVVELVVTGVFHASAAEPFRRALLAYISDSDDVRGLIVDLRRATILIGADIDSLPCAKSADTGTRLRPVALIVPPVSTAPFLRWAGQSAAGGLLHGAFVDAEDALAWVRARTEAKQVSFRSGRSRVFRDA